jgi:hypothetical protein
MVPGQCCNSASENQALSFTEHDAILQTLDRASNRVFLNKEAFEPTVEKWQDVPLIYSSKGLHPDPDAWDKSPEAELARIGGRIIDGKVVKSYIEQTGHPRLMGKLQLSDQEIVAGIKAGKISTSTGMRVPHDSTQLKGIVSPHHILFFQENGESMPGDLGAFILNTATDSQAEKIKLIDRLKALLLGGQDENSKGAMEMADANLEKELAQVRQEAGDAKLAFTKLQGQMDETIKAKDAELKKLQDEVLAFKKKEADSKWLAFTSKYVPPGLLQGDGAKTLRAEYEADPLAFAMKMLDQKRVQADQAQDGAEPLAFVAPKPIIKDQEFSKKLAEAGIPSLEVEGAD